MKELTASSDQESISSDDQGLNQLEKDSVLKILHSNDEVDKRLLRIYQMNLKDKPKEDQQQESPDEVVKEPIVD